MHGKETIFSEPMRSVGFAVRAIGLDTDAFGTFAGEKARIGSAREVVVKKAQAALAQAQLPIGLASEGTFSAHPAVPYLTINYELAAFVDVEDDVVVIGDAAKVSATPAPITITYCDETALEQVTTWFPSQAAIVVDRTCEPVKVFAKGCTDENSLRTAVQNAFTAGANEIVIEPDLRAHCCADRRDVIALAVADLCTRLKSHCPACGQRGFGKATTKGGLPCQLCELPTTQIAAEIWQCPKCETEVEHPRPGFADPTHCDRCNP